MQAILDRVLPPISDDPEPPEPERRGQLDSAEAKVGRDQ